MFLTKKTAILTNKPKNTDNNKPKKALAGWGDDDEPFNIAQKSTVKSVNLHQTENKKQFSVDTKQQNNLKNTLEIIQTNVYYTWDQLNVNQSIQCEKRLVQEIVQPGGIRIKPNQSNLSQFFKDAKSMQVQNIGSLLLSKLEVNYAFAIKAKALYTIEYIAKKNVEFMNYFKNHTKKFIEFPEPEDNVQNYRKILKSVLASFGLQQTAIVEQKQNYVDPGYYQEHKSQLSNFIHENGNKPKNTAPKKSIIGPGQSKAKGVDKIEKQEPIDKDLMLLSLDEKVQKEKHQGLDLLQQLSSKPKQSDLIDM